MHCSCCGYHAPCPRCLHGAAAPVYPSPYAPCPPAPAYRPAPEEDYVRRLEDERDALERRLRRMESQIAELQKGGG